MKPNWKDAPAWAMWLAQDKSGDWYFYATEPEKRRTYWRTATHGNRSLACFGEANQDWENTLEKRPEQ